VKRGERGSSNTDSAAGHDRGDPLRGVDPPLKSETSGRLSHFYSDITGRIPRALQCNILSDACVGPGRNARANDAAGSADGGFACALHCPCHLASQKASRHAQASMNLRHMLGKR